MNNISKPTYSRTIQVAPQQAELLNSFVDRIIPVLEKRIAQGALPNGLTPEQQIEALLNFGHDKSEQIDILPQTQQPKKVAQGGLNSNELFQLDRLLEFGRSFNKRRGIEEET